LEVELIHPGAVRFVGETVGGLDFHDMEPTASALEKEVDVTENLRVLGVGEFDLTLPDETPCPEDGVH
jgi:hypothetical protein